MENNLLWPLNTRQHEFKMRRQELRNTYKENCAMFADQLQAVKDLHRKEEEEMRAKFEQRKNEMLKRKIYLLSCCQKIILTLIRIL